MSRVLHRADRRTVTASIRDDGALVISGQDFGGWAGTTEYEYALTVAAADVSVVLVALGEPADADVLDTLERHAATIIGAGERTWLTSIGVDAEFWNHHAYD